VFGVFVLEADSICFQALFNDTNEAIYY